MAANPFMLDALRRRLPDREFYSDVLRNAAGLPEVALTMGTGLVSQAGTGLGTLAGMGMQKLRGEDVDLDAASDTIADNAEKFTFAPRSTAGKEAMRGLGTVMEPIDRGMQAVGQKAADVTDSPAVGAAVYTGLNVLDPELLAPGAAKIAALRGAQGIARGAAASAVPMGEALRSVPRGQRGAYTLEDLAGTEGDFSFRSPTLEAFGRLKPQEQGRVSGQQLMKALMREGAKKEELAWMGLDQVLATPDILDVADVRRIAETNEPQIEFRTARGGGELDDEAINEKAREMAWEDSDLEYPENYYVQSYGERLQEPGRGGRYRDKVFASESEARDYIDSMREQEYEYILRNEGEHTDPDEWEAMTDAEKEAYADEAIRSFDDEHSIDNEVDPDSEPTNIDELTEYWEQQIRDRPQDYDIEGGGGPAYGEYTVGRAGSGGDANYSVSSGNLAREERFGKGGETPGFLAPYMREAEQGVDPNNPQLPLLVTEVDGQGIGGPRKRAFQLEALRRQAREADPNAEKFRQRSSRSHYDELGDDQMFFVRETDRPAPPWGSVQEGIGRTETGFMRDPGGQVLEQTPEVRSPLRMMEENQSDWLQAGRKTGWAEPKELAKIEKEGADEASRVSAFQQQALDEIPVALANDTFAPYLAEVKQRNAAARELGTEPEYNDLRTEQALNRYINSRGPNVDMGERMVAARELFSQIYRANDNNPTETAAVQMRDALDRLPTITESPLSKITPSAPMKETRQWMKLALADALRRAVVEGQQYFGFTKGDVHAKRWGSDTFQYAPSADNPRQIRWQSEGSVRDNPDKSALENLQQSADTLLDNEYASTLDLDDPQILDKLTGIVEQYLNYGMSEYRNPKAQMRKRAEALLKDLNKASEAAAAGDRRAAHYSPRAHGTVASYDALEQDLADLLREAGSSAEIRDLQLEGAMPGSTRAIEIDPELARAAKRGFRLPY